MKEKKMKLIDDDTQSKVIESSKEVIEEKRKVGRPTILTPELRTKLIKLFEEHFFIAIVAAKAGIYRYHIYEWIREQESFNTAVTHAQGKWIAQQMDLLRNYAKNKREKDWRALRYLLSIADAEFNDKKYLREEPGKRDSTQITIIIDRKDLETSKIEAEKVIGESKLEEEPVSLILFNEEKKEKREKKGEKEKSGEAETQETLSMN